MPRNRTWNEETYRHIVDLPLRYDKKLKKLGYLTDASCKSGAIAVAIEVALPILEMRPELAIQLRQHPDDAKQILRGI